MRYTRNARKKTTRRQRPSRRRSCRRSVGGEPPACPIPGNTTWKEYCRFLPERANLFFSVMNKLHCSAKPGKPLNFSYFADGQCDLVSIAILETIKKMQKPWKIRWISSKVNGTSHIFLYDMDVKLCIDLTARQFFPGEDTIAGTEEQMKALGYEFPVDEEGFKNHLPTVIEEVREALDPQM